MLRNGVESSYIWLFENSSFVEPLHDFAEELGAQVNEESLFYDVELDSKDLCRLYKIVDLYCRDIQRESPLQDSITKLIEDYNKKEDNYSSGLYLIDQALWPVLEGCHEVMQSSLLYKWIISSDWCDGYSPNSFKILDGYKLTLSYR